MTTIQPIETHYKGYRFRSRLEARWAVFFDVLGLRWEYEPEGFDLGKAGWYLPDFWLPDFELWIEIKPTLPTDYDFRKFLSFTNQQHDGGNRIKMRGVMLCGSPGIPTITVENDGIWDLHAGYVALNPIVVKRLVALNPIAEGKNFKVDPVEYCSIDDEDSEIICFVEAFAFTQGGKNLDVWPLYATTGSGVDGGNFSVFLNSKKITHNTFWSFLYPSGMLKRYYTGEGVVYDAAPLRMAYTAARSARFEHGERP